MNIDHSNNYGQDDSNRKKMGYTFGHDITSLIKLSAYNTIKVLFHSIFRVGLVWWVGGLVGAWVGWLARG